jgi:hypothetical protein
MMCWSVVSEISTNLPHRKEGGDYATSRKVASLRPDEVNEYFSIYLILPATLGPGVYSASNKNEY